MTAFIGLLTLQILCLKSANGFALYDYEDSETCGQPTTPPGGGRLNRAYSAPMSAPWQARLCLAYHPYPPVCFCGGVLVSESVVLTAAHCFNELTTHQINYKLFVQLGQGGATYYPRQNGLIKHPSFERRTYDHDIAILFLSRDVTFNYSILPACLPDPDTPVSLGAGFVTGWDTGTRLRELPTTPVRWQACVNTPRHKDYIITTNMFCAKETSPFASIVKGFSGGPLVALQDGKWVLQGLVSWGIPYTDIAVFTEVAKYTSWLDDWGVGW